MIVFQTDPPQEHENINWKFNEKQVLNVENIVIHHFWQKKGIEDELLQFAETFAHDNNFKAIRLDAYAIDEYIVDLYKKKNYEKAGETFFSFQKIPFICFEKKL